MGRIFIGILVSLLFGCSFSSSTIAQESCKLKTPPHNAAITEIHGFFFFVFPRTINISSYSGCQTMWDEKGNAWFILMFEKGSLIKYESNDSSGISAKQICWYEHGSLTSHDSKECPDYDGVKDGFRTLPINDEPIVPPERDPRK